MEKFNLQQLNSLHNSVHQMEIRLNGLMMYLENIEFEEDEQQKKYYQKCLEEELERFNYYENLFIKQIKEIEGE